MRTLCDLTNANRESARFAEALQQIDPDARCEAGRWFSTILKPEECDTALLDPTDLYIKVLIGKKLPGGVLWVSMNGPQVYRQSMPHYLDLDGRLQAFVLGWATGIAQ